MDLISIEGVQKAYNDRVLLRGVSLSIAAGERVGLLGLNGSGKSTLLRILAGLEPPDEGARVVRRGLRFGYLEQEPQLDPEQTAREVVGAGLAAREEVLARLEHLHEELAEAPDERIEGLLKTQARLEHELEEAGGHDVEHRVEATLQSLGVPSFEARCGSMSGGERRRVALARLLVAQPELLLLDEPTNHLDAFVTDWLEDWFLDTGTPLLLVTHDRYFLDRVVDRIIELDRGELVGYAGGYADYLEARAGRLETERKTESSRLNLLRRETAWMRRGAPARSTKAKARIKRFEQLRDDVPIALSDELDFAIPPGPRLGARVVKLSGASARRGDRLVVPPLDVELRPGTRLGIVGPNGAGKTTLVQMLTGELELAAGAREVGETVRFMGIDQARSDLNLDSTVAETLAGRSDVIRTDDRVVRVEGFLGRFGFPASKQSAPVRSLSGGEKNRLLLACLLCAGGNVLVLDEPTNDLDLQTLRALEEALLAFPGAAILVSHDRWFLDRVATQILHLDGEGGVRMHHGDFSGLLEKLAAEREQEKSAAVTTATKRRTPGGDGGTGPKKKRITPWQLKELEELEERIAALEAESEKVGEQLGDASLYTGPRATLDEVRARQAAVSAELEAAFARWEELESLR